MRRTRARARSRTRCERAAIGLPSHLADDRHPPPVLRDPVGSHLLELDHAAACRAQTDQGESDQSLAGTWAAVFESAWIDFSRVQLLQQQQQWEQQQHEQREQHDKASPQK